MINYLVEIEHAITRAIYAAQSSAEDILAEDLKKLRMAAEHITQSCRAK